MSRESKGLAVLEAWANGVPAVLPAHGAFPELLADTGGGLLYAAGNPAALAAGLRQMIEQPGTGRRVRPPGARGGPRPLSCRAWRPGELWSYMKAAGPASLAGVASGVGVAVALPPGATVQL